MAESDRTWFVTSDHHELTSLDEEVRVFPNPTSGDVKIIFDQYYSRE
jgi:hypothetical protein